MGATIFYNGAADIATLSAVFSAGSPSVPTDPTALTLVVTDPQGTTTTWNWPGGPNTLTRLSAGSFQALQPCSAIDGLWQYVWVGTGTASDIFQGTFTVLPETAGQWYCSAEELKSRMAIPDTADDFEIQLAVQAAARGIEKYTGRYFWRGTDTRTYVPDGTWLTHVDDLVSVTTLKTDSSGTGVFDVTWTQGTDFELALGERSYNVNASGEPWPYREIRVIGGGSKFFPFVWPLFRQDRIQITGVFGWPAVPALVKQAAIQLAAEYFKLKDAPWGVAGFAEFGVIRVQAGSQLAGELDPYVDPRRKVGV